MLTAKSVPITELMDNTERWLLSRGYKKSTLGVYKATWNRFRLFSESPLFNVETAEAFLLQYYGVDVHQLDQKLDTRMRHARRHMSALTQYFLEGTVCRRKINGIAEMDDSKFEAFFSEYLKYCKMQNYSDAWIDSTMSGLRLFLLAIHASGTSDIYSINTTTVEQFSQAISNAGSITANSRRIRSRQVGAYLNWLYVHHYTDKDYSHQLPNFKGTAPLLPQVWEPEEIDRILAAIDTANPVGKRNYAMFLLLARTGLRISDVVGLKLSNIDWRNNCITLSQRKTGSILSLPLSKELGVAIISYLRNGRPQSSSEYVFLSQNAPFHPLGEHNNFHPELRKYIRRAGIKLPSQKHAGVHTFRHSFATNMLKQGASVQDISQILGHGDINVTETYLRVDIEQLRLCSMSLEAL